MSKTWPNPCRAVIPCSECRCKYGGPSTINGQTCPWYHILCRQLKTAVGANRHPMTTWWTCGVLYAFHQTVMAELDNFRKGAMRQMYYFFFYYYFFFLCIIARLASIIVPLLSQWDYSCAIIPQTAICNLQHFSNDKLAGKCLAMQHPHILYLVS